MTKMCSKNALALSKETVSDNWVIPGLFKLCGKICRSRRIAFYSSQIR